MSEPVDQMQAQSQPEPAQKRLGWGSWLGMNGLVWGVLLGAAWTHSVVAGAGDGLQFMAIALGCIFTAIALWDQCLRGK